MTAASFAAVGGMRCVLDARSTYACDSIATPPSPATIPQICRCWFRIADDILLTYVLQRPAGVSQVTVSAPSLEAARAAIVESGIEVFRVKGDTIQLAERVRSHLMDAGVSVCFGERPRIEFTVRVQNSDFPGTAAEEMFNKVRHSTASRAQSRGFSEFDSRCRPVHDPVDNARVLDVWYELTFAKDTHDLEQLMDDVRWALRVTKCVSL